MVRFETLIQIVLSTALISLISLSGLTFLSIKKRTLNKAVPLLVSLAGGVLMGTAFLHLIPESNNNLLIITGFLLMMVIEKFLHWRHCHEKNCKTHLMGYTNLVGDGLHNFLDGLIIGATYLTNTELGVITTLAVMLHEIPQEVGDFGVLLHSGFKLSKALILNFLISLTSIVGGVASFFLASGSQTIINLLIPLAAGSFIYISSVDITPEIVRTKKLKNSITSMTIFIIGILITSLL